MIIKASNFLHSKFAIIMRDGYNLAQHVIDTGVFTDPKDETPVVVDFTDMTVVSTPFLNDFATSVHYFITANGMIKPVLLRLVMKGIDPERWAPILYSHCLFMIDPDYRGIAYQYYI